MMINITMSWSLASFFSMSAIFAFRIAMSIAETILFLASEQARMITGQVIKVSGGKALQSIMKKYELEEVDGDENII